MKRLWAPSIFLFSVFLMNGCSKCSREEAPAPPPTPPPVEDTVLPAIPSDMETPADSEPVPSDQDSSSPNESVD